jgi:hypothetical protein
LGSRAAPDNLLLEEDMFIFFSFLKELFLKMQVHASGVSTV